MLASKQHSFALREGQLSLSLQNGDLIDPSLHEEAQEAHRRAQAVAEARSYQLWKPRFKERAEWDQALSEFLAERLAEGGILLADYRGHDVRRKIQPRSPEGENIPEAMIDMLAGDEDTRAPSPFGESANEFHSADELRHAEGLHEGALERIVVNAYERSPRARQECIAHYGCKCVVCEFDFEEIYGEIGRNFIHVHHLVPLSEIGEEYRVDPIRDLRPVCPNCHAMLHRRVPPFSVSELRGKL
ncbi:HNH endonuclease [Haliangium ochraceum]|uniref:HNH endonuclease n=1 Tax=Haliangium ochraceum TaxID=80816 RepID=UPI0018EF50BE|nr:HNH endonuclease [Haliangium ochraceum]